VSSRHWRAAPIVATAGLPRVRLGKGGLESRCVITPPPRRTATMFRCHSCDMTDWVCPSCQRAFTLGQRWHRSPHGYKDVCSACYWRARRATEHHKTHRCQACECAFTTTRTDARYCSSRCRQNAHRMRAARSKIDAIVAANDAAADAHPPPTAALS
jgi:hypothetical protein